jgi:hypothetical protein
MKPYKKLSQDFHNIYDYKYLIKFFWPITIFEITHPTFIFIPRWIQVMV